MVQRVKWSVVVVLLVLSGCTSTDLSVRIDPSDADMASVTVDGRQARRMGPGAYLGEVSADKGQTKSVSVVATSGDGIRIDEQAQVVGGQSSQATLRMPAEVHVSVGSGEASEVRLNGELVDASEGVFKRRFEMGAEPLEVRVDGRSMEGARDEQRVTVRAGEIGTVTLEFGLNAYFSMSQERVVFGDEVRFDASQSSPSRSIVSYRWTFGDGSPAVTTDEPTISHRYDFDPARGTSTEYQVQLQVTNQEGLTDTTSERLPGSLDQTTLVLDLTAFPNDRAWYHPGEEVQLRLTPREGVKPASLADVVIDFGDGSRRQLVPAGQPVELDCDDDGCTPLVVRHAYTVPGLYAPRLTYSHGKPGLEGPYTAELRDRSGEAPELAVVPVYQTPKQLEDAAWRDAYEQIDLLLHEAAAAAGRTQPHGVKLALTSLESANFEGDGAAVDVLDRLTHLLVADGYHVLEKKSSVLARLAFESVIDVREERKTGGTAGLVDDPFYRPHLDYGLVTDNSGEQLHYGVRIEGTESRLTQLDQAGGATKSDTDLSDERRPAERASASERSDQSFVAMENLPIYMARFDTAEQLLAVHVLAPPELRSVPGVSYNALFDETESQAVVSLALRVRLLDRSGRILHTREIIGMASDMLIPRFVPQPLVELPVFGD